MISNKKLLKIGLGTPLAFGTMAFIGGSLPGKMGSTMTSALSPATPMVGAITKVSMAGVLINTTRNAFNFDKLKRRKY